MAWLPKRAQRVDLSETSDFFLALKADPSSWRERVVAELGLGRRNHVRSTSAFQIEFPPNLIEEFVNTKRARAANVLLPLTTRDKRPLLNLSVTGPGGSPATVLARASIAALQAIYLGSVVNRSPRRAQLVPFVDERLWEAICAFSPSFFVSNFFDPAEGDLDAAVTAYLASGLNLELDVAQVSEWRNRTKGARQALCRHLREAPDDLSSSEQVLLAIPGMSPLPRDGREIDGIIESYARLVETADAGGDEQLLTALAEYGRRYELIVEVEVPLLEACRLKVAEDLPLELERRGRQYWAKHQFPLQDARSAHLEVRLDDPGIEFPELRDRGKDLGIEIQDLERSNASGWLEAVRVTREALAIYSSEPGRPKRVEIAFRLALARQVAVTCAVLIVLNLAAAVGAFAMGSDGELASKLAVLAIPTTVAAAFVLVREQTALATRLQAGPRLLLAGSALALWLVVVLRLLSWNGVDHQPTRRRPVDPPSSTGRWTGATRIESQRNR